MDKSDTADAVWAGVDWNMTNFLCVFASSCEPIFAFLTRQREGVKGDLS